MTASELNTWAISAKRGEAIVYHTGNLSEDRFWHKSWPIDKKTPAQAADAMGEVAWRLMESGMVSLVQRRNGKGCDYIAQAIER